MSHFPEGNSPPVRYRVVHETHYSYQFPVTLSQQYLHLTPRSFEYQQTESQTIWVDPQQEHHLR